MLGKASKKGRGSASLLFVCANKGELGFSPFFTGSNKALPLPSARRATLCPDVWSQQLRISTHALPGEGGLGGDSDEHAQVISIHAPAREGDA